MPDTFRINGGCAHPWRNGFLAAIATGIIVPFPARAEPKPALALHELVLTAQDSIAHRRRKRIVGIGCTAGILTHALRVAYSLKLTRYNQTNVYGRRWLCRI